MNPALLTSCKNMWDKVCITFHVMSITLITFHHVCWEKVWIDPDYNVRQFQSSCMFSHCRHSVWRHCIIICGYVWNLNPHLVDNEESSTTVFGTAIISGCNFPAVLHEEVSLVVKVSIQIMSFKLRVYDNLYAMYVYSHTPFAPGMKCGWAAMTTHSVIFHAQHHRFGLLWNRLQTHVNRDDQKVDTLLHTQTVVATARRLIACRNARQQRSRWIKQLKFIVSCIKYVLSTQASTCVC